MLNGLFQSEKNGITSLRRVSAFLLVLTCIAAVILSIFYQIDKWLALMTIGIPGVLSCVILGLINSEDIAKITGSLKK